MEKSNQLPKTEACSAEGEPVDLWCHRVERPSRSVSRDKCEPQAGPASCLSNSASKAADASGDGVSVPEPKTEMPEYGEGIEGLPGSKSVARAEADARDGGGGPKGNNVPRGVRGVETAHGIRGQSRRGRTAPGEGADVLAKPTQATR